MCMSHKTQIHSTREALEAILVELTDKLVGLNLDEGPLGTLTYSDSDYDRLENLLTVANTLLTADYEEDLDVLKGCEAPWVHNTAVANWLKENQ